MPGRVRAAPAPGGTSAEARPGAGSDYKRDTTWSRHARDAHAQPRPRRFAQPAGRPAVPGL